MKKYKVMLLFVVTLILTLTLVACKDKTKVNFEKENVAIKVGETYELKYSVT